MFAARWNKSFTLIKDLPSPSLIILFSHGAVHSSPFTTLIWRVGLCVNGQKLPMCKRWVREDLNINICVCVRASARIKRNDKKISLSHTTRTHLKFSILVWRDIVISNILDTSMRQPSLVQRTQTCYTMLKQMYSSLNWLNIHENLNNCSKVKENSGLIRLFINRSIFHSPTCFPLQSPPTPGFYLNTLFLSSHI